MKHGKESLVAMIEFLCFKQVILFFMITKERYIKCGKFKEHFPFKKIKNGHHDKLYPGLPGQISLR